MLDNVLFQEVIAGVNPDIVLKSFVSILVFIGIVLIRKLVLKKIRAKSQRIGQDRRHQMNTVKQLSNGMLFVALILIWASEVQHLAFSVAAFVVAIVLATREFLQCLLGFFYYLFTRPFRVGEWIQVGSNTSGEVYAIDWVKITLLEVDSETFEYTGKTVYIPNSYLITKTLKNLNFMRRYNLHAFKVTVEANPALVGKLAEMRSIVARHCASFRDIALRYKETIERHLEIEFIAVEPTVNLKTNTFGLLEIHIAFFCPTEQALSIQQSITEELLSITSLHLSKSQIKYDLPEMLS